MNVLFLSQETSDDSKRDTVTYNFIVKEMLALRENNVNVTFLSFSENNGRIEGVPVLKAASLLNESKIVRRIKNVLFLIRNISMFSKKHLKDLRRVLWRVYCERAILACIAKLDIDIVHTHFFVPEGGGGVVLKKYCHVLILATCRGTEICNMPEYDYGGLRCEHYKASLLSALPFFDAITVPNKFYKEKMIHAFSSVDSEKITVLYNGVEKIAVVRTEKILSVIPTFICIGNLIPLKNYELIFQAIDLLKGRYEFKVILVGDGVLKGKFTELIKNSYKDYVFLHNEMPKADLYKMIASADCFVHPSFSEGGANVILEALAIGVPCIVSDIMSMQKEIIQEGVNGFFFDPKDSVELSKKMEYAMINRSKIFEMEKPCRNSVTPYTLKKKINGYLEIYHKMYSGREV